jgi:phage protein D
MSLSKLADSTSNFYVPRFEIKIKDKKVPEKLANSISSITVNERISEGSGFTLTVNDEFDMSTQTFTWLDDDLLQVGNKIEISIGYKSTLLTMIKGKITGLNPTLFTGTPPTITVNGQDISYDSLKRSSPEETFENMSYSDIAGAVAKKSGLTASTDKTSKLEEPVTKSNIDTYFSFLQDLARDVGFKVWIDRETQALCFKKPQDNKKEIMTLDLGKDIISFNPTMNTVNLVSEVEVRGHNPEDPSTPIIGIAKAGSEQAQESGRQQASQIAAEQNDAPKKVITGRIVRSKSEADAVALAELNKASDTFIQGDVKCIGIPEIRPGVCIKLDKMGKRFSGKYYVETTTHTVDDSGYQTTFGVKRNAV